MVAHHLDADGAVPDDSRRRTLLLRVKTYIQQHLHDPDLAPSVIAAAHYIPVSYLHRVFEAEDETVAVMIRRVRLEHAHRDLADPALQATPIHAIATRWGLSRAADVSRAFCTAYGTAPKDHRHQALQDRLQAEH